MTVRTWDNTKDLLSQWEHFQYNSNGVLTENYQGTSTVGTSGNKGKGENIPNFHRRRKRGELLRQTSFSKFTCCGNITGEYEQYAPTGTHTYRVGNCPYTSGIPTEESLEAYVAEHEYLAQQAASRIATSGFDALTFLAEFSEIPKLFLNLGEKILKTKTLKGSANNWLEYRYGWRPLLKDLTDLNEAITKINEKASRTRYSERVRRKLDSGTSHSDTIPYSKSYKELHLIIDDTYTVYGSGSVVADITIPAFQFNPMLTAWEIIPYSFVLDWFIGVGQSLSAVTFLLLNTSYSASSGYKVELTREVSTYVDYDSTSGYSGKWDSEGYYEATLERRVPCQVSTKPQFKLGIDIYKILDLTGMIIQKRG